MPTLLVVDDEPSNIQVLAEALKGEYRVLFALCGQEALEMVDNSEIDLILLDVIMPGMDGLEVLRRLKANERTATIPVIFVTAITDENNEASGLTLGAVDYVAKPFRPAVVRARVNTHLEIRRQRELLERHAFIDSLTGIGNRRRFDGELDSRWETAQAESRPLSLLMVDIDYFKRFNDCYGHTVGDRCLRRVATILTDTFDKPDDLPCRFGGEEFVVLLDPERGEDLKGVMNALLHAVNSVQIPHTDSPIVGHVTVSAGAVTMEVAASQCIANLIEAADKLLYRAKENGRNAGCYRDDRTTAEGCVKGE